MRDITMTMELDNKILRVVLPIDKNASIVQYEKVLNAINKAMLRSIKKIYLHYSQRDLIIDCLQKEGI